MAGPCLEINISEKGRATLMMVITAMSGLCLLLSLAMVACGAYIKLSIEEKLNLIGDYNNDILPWLLVALGCLSFFISIVGVIAMNWCQDVSRRAKIKALLLPYVCVGLFLAICVLATSLLTFAQIAHIHDSFGLGIGEAMRKYKYEKELKEQIDGLQIGYQCCGMKSYVDWFRISWVHDKFLNTSSEVIKAKLVQGEYYNDDAPFSCCDPKSVRPCVHHHVHHNDVHYQYDYRTAITLHKLGCQDALGDYFRTMLVNCGALIIAIFAVQNILVILMRFLQTSVTKAYELGDPTGDAPGWLFPPCGKETADDHKEEQAHLLKDDFHGSHEHIFNRSRSRSHGSGFDGSFDDHIYDMPKSPLGAKQPMSTFVGTRKKSSHAGSLYQTPNAAKPGVPPPPGPPPGPAGGPPAAPPPPPLPPF